MSIAAIPLLQDDLEVARHHFRDHVLEARRMRPAELLLGLARVAEEEVDLGRSEITRVDADQCLSRRAVHPHLFASRALPGEGTADITEGDLDQFAHGMRLAGREHEIVRLSMLENAPHAVDIVAGMAPVT